MLRILDEGQTLCDGLTRREWLRIGSLGLGGLTLPNLLQSQAHATPNRKVRAKSVILFCLFGGPPQHETWDPKPDAPKEIRGEFGTIATKTPGLRVGELMPMTAKLTDKIAVLRAVVTNDNAHSSSGYQMLTGIPHQPMNRENALPKAPNNWPSIGAMVRAVKSDQGQLPSAVTIPEHMWNDGNIPWPGQDAGILGQKYHPWLLHCDPSSDSFNVSGLKLPQEVPAVRLNQRRSLLQQVNQRLDDAQRHQQPINDYDRHAQRAFDLLTGSQARSAFEMKRESSKMRDRYGRSRFAQSCLLARRLVEAGVSLVQVNWTRIKGKENNGGWDTHKKHSDSLKSFLMPMMDQAFSALVEDLDQRGLLDETLVVWFGEFGRTPKFNKNAGRDHWGKVFSLAMAGGGIRGGIVHGQSDKQAAYPKDGIVTPPDLIATLFHSLGYAPDTEIHDRLNRPIPVTRGKIIRAIL